MRKGGRPVRQAFENYCMKWEEEVEEALLNGQLRQFQEKPVESGYFQTTRAKLLSTFTDLGYLLGGWDLILSCRII